MKVQKSLFAKQQGFTLIESLVALILFSIIVIGSSGAIKYMLNTQRDMNLSHVVINELQKRLQQAQDKSDISNICNRVNTTAFSINTDLTYYISCKPSSLPVGGVNIEWPVLAASSISQSVSESCLSHTYRQVDSSTLTAEQRAPHYSCYIVGE